MPSDPTFWVTFARWLPARYADLPHTLKDDFVVDLIGCVTVLAPIAQSFPTTRNVGTIALWFWGRRDPLAPVRDRIRNMRVKWDGPPVPGEVPARKET